MLELDPAPKVITFDCYGTLVQWGAAVTQAAEAILPRHHLAGAPPGSAGALATRLREAALANQQRLPFREYRSILQASLEEALADIGRVATSEDQQTLLSILRRIPPHPDVRTALARLHTRYRLAIISNTDDDLIAETVAGIGEPFDHVITAQQARAYKPDPRLFLHAYAAMGVSKDETLHVGMGQFTDLKVCHELGVRSIWIDRTGEALNADWAPHAVLPDLSGLPELLLGS